MNDAHPHLFEVPTTPSALRGLEVVSSATAPEWQQPRPVQEFFIPVWHAVRLTPTEVELVDHPAFTRLADIYQLGQTHLVYRGATHKRWEHALGTLHAAQLMVGAVAANHADARAKAESGHPDTSAASVWLRGESLFPYEVAFIRVASLLHDIGHLAAGHTFEDELGLLDKHDGDARLNHVLDRRVWRGRTVHTSMRELLDERLHTAAQASGLGMSPSEIFLAIVSKDRADTAYDSGTFRMSACRDIVGNTICADLIDYLHRDLHHLGKPRAFDARLLDYLEIRERRDQPSTGKLVLNLRGGAKVRNDAVTAVFELLEARYQLGEIALYHRTKLIASAMLERLVAEVADAAGGSSSWFAGQVDKLLECSDEEMLGELRRLGTELRAGLKGDKARRLGGALALAEDLRSRRLHKTVFDAGSQQLGNRVAWVRDALGGRKGASARLADARNLEADFGLPSASVAIYCPERPPHAKIARVNVLLDDVVRPLNEIEDPGRDQTFENWSLTAGLLAAQQRRFDQLWHVQVSVSPDALDQLKKQGTLRDFKTVVDDLLLRRKSDPDELVHTARELAGRLIANQAVETPGVVLLAKGESAARTRTMITYTTGAPTLSSLMVATG